jgi:hypothetical protein
VEVAIEKVQEEEPKSEGTVIESTTSTGATANAKEEVPTTTTTSLAIEADQPAALGESDKSTTTTTTDPVKTPEMDTAKETESVAAAAESLTKEESVDKVAEETVKPSNDEVKAIEPAAADVDQVKGAAEAEVAVTATRDEAVESSRTGSLASGKEKVRDSFPPPLRLLQSCNHFIIIF